MSALDEESIGRLLEDDFVNEELSPDTVSDLVAEIGRQLVWAIDDSYASYHGVVSALDAADLIQQLTEKERTYE